MKHRFLVPLTRGVFRSHVGREQVLIFFGGGRKINKAPKSPKVWKISLISPFFVFFRIYHSFIIKSGGGGTFTQKIWREQLPLLPPPWLRPCRWQLTVADLVRVPVSGLVEGELGGIAASPQQQLAVLSPVRRQRSYHRVHGIQKDDTRGKSRSKSNR